MHQAKTSHSTPARAPHATSNRLIAREIARREHLRQIMDLAWDLYRCELRGPSPRSFRDALAGAWRFVKRESTLRQPAWARGTGNRTVSFGSMVQSPIRRSLRGQAYAATKARAAGYCTSMIGG